jgi:hypothetical protein
MPFAQGLTTEQVGKRKEKAVVTKATEAIVTVLGEGPCSALALSQRLTNVTHANARQTLRRLAEAGVVTRLRRGLYGLSDNPQCDTTSDGSPVSGAKPWPGPPPPCIPTEAQIDAAIAGAWAHFEAMNDPLRLEAWA